MVQSNNCVLTYSIVEQIKYISKLTRLTYQYKNLIVGPVKTAAFCILSILSGFDA